MNTSPSTDIHAVDSSTPIPTTRVSESKPESPAPTATSAGRGPGSPLGGTNASTDPSLTSVANLAPPPSREPAPAVDEKKQHESQTHITTGGQNVTDLDGGPSNQDHAPSIKLDDKATGLTTATDRAKEGNTPSASPRVASAALRAPTPSSRTSTPPLHATKKKFTAVSVNKEFLSKAASPQPVPAKQVRPAAPTAPAASPFFKLLSTKLTSVPSSKPSTSPMPTGPAGASGTPTSSPWAKPTLPPPEPPTASSIPLRHPAPTRGNLSNVTMGSGHGLGGSGATRRAWGSVAGGEPRKLGPGLSRDFPTAKEVADGKRAAMLSAQAVAQAEAAHNQAILAGLNEFTHLEPNTHRWDEEDEDDDVIDFGDGRSFPHIDSRPREPAQVAKSERFGDDFDRSWPKRDISPRRVGGPGGPGPRNERVLFNATSNRLESVQRGQTQPGQPGQPGRFMSREPPPHAGGHDRPDRPLPPHSSDSGRMLPPHMSSSHHFPPQQSWRRESTGEHDRERPVPPHLSDHHRSPPSHTDRLPPSSRQPPSSLPPSRTLHSLPPHSQPPSAGQSLSAASKSAPAPAPLAAPAPVSVPAPDPTSPKPSSALPEASLSASAVAAATNPSGPVVSETVQAAEMHSAAEKAKQRRQAEETEREAAAERARQKARALAERFGDKLKPAEPATTAPAVTSPPESNPAPTNAPLKAPPGLSVPQPPPGLSKPPQQITIAPRPRPTGGAPPREPRTTDVPAQPENGLTSPQLSQTEQRRPDRPADLATSWRRNGPLPPAVESQSQGDLHGRLRRPSVDQARPAGLPSRGEQISRRGVGRELPPHVSGNHARDAPPHSRSPRDLPSSDSVAEQTPVDLAAPVPEKALPRKDTKFDTVLARLQATMAKARRSPPPGIEQLDAAATQQPKPAHRAAPEPVAVVPASPATAEPPTLPVPAAVQGAKPSRPTSIGQPRVAKPVPASPRLPHLPPEYFDATQSEPPRSPPPAWRQYNVKLPKTARQLGSIPRLRLKQADQNHRYTPKGWSMSYEPPVEGLGSGQVIADALLPQPIGRRFVKQMDTGPIVSISPRSLVPFEKKKKGRHGTADRPAESTTGAAPYANPPPTVVESYQTEPALPSEVEPVRNEPTPAAPQKKLEKSGNRFTMGTESVSAAKHLAHVATAASADKQPAVRFMVSSELDGDSLLDEINKMSLEHIGDADEKRSTSGQSGPKPRTPPPSNIVPPAPRNMPSSPGGAGPGPWAKSSLTYPVTSPARGNSNNSSQRDHIKSVWEQTTDTSTSTASAAASAPSQPDTPLYPTLNTPAAATTDLTSGSQSLKPGYPSLASSASTFGMRSGSMTQGNYSGQYMASAGTSPDAMGGMGVQYGLMGRNASGSAANGFQQAGLWASSFGSPMAQPGYGYTANKAGLDQKSGAFGPATKDQAMPYANTSSGDYRYGGAVQAAGSGAGGYQGNAGFNGYATAGQYGRNAQSIYSQVGGYGFGTQVPPVRVAGGGGRFPTVNGVGGQGVGVEYQAMGYDPNSGSAAYYSPSGGAQHAYGPGGYGGVGGVQGQQGGGGRGSGRKMW